MTDTEQEAVEVSAEVVDGGLAKPPAPAIRYTLPSASIENADALEAYVAGIEAFFSDVRIDVYDDEQRKQLKAVAADVNKVAKGIDDKRKQMEREVKGAVSEQSRVLTKLRDRVRAVYDSAREQIEEADRIEKERRFALLDEEFRMAAPDLMALIPLERFVAIEPKLLGRTWRDDKACAVLDDMIVKVVTERDLLRGSGLAFPAEADMAYCRTLDLAAAHAENARLVEERNKKAVFEAEARELDRRIGKAVSEAAEVPCEPTKTWRVEFDATSSKAHAAADALRFAGVAWKSFKAVG